MSSGGLLVDRAQAPLLARPYYARGDPGPIVAALAQVPELLELTMPFLAGVLGPSAVDLRSKEIVILRTSALAGCRYCVAAHTVAALDAGLSRVEVAALRRKTGLGDTFGLPREAALVRWVDAVAAGGPVSEDARRDLRAHWADHHVVELTLLVGATLMLNRFATALDLPSAADTLDRLEREGLHQ